MHVKLKPGGDCGATVLTPGGPSLGHYKKINCLTAFLMHAISLQRALYLKKWPPDMQKCVINSICDDKMWQSALLLLWKAEKVSYILPFVLHMHLTQDTFSVTHDT